MYGSVMPCAADRPISKHRAPRRAMNLEPGQFADRGPCECECDGVDIAPVMSDCVGNTKRDRPSHMGRPAPKDTTPSLAVSPFNFSLIPPLAGRPTLSITHKHSPYAFAIFASASKRDLCGRTAASHDAWSRSGRAGRPTGV